MVVIIKVVIWHLSLIVLLFCPMLEDSEQKLKPSGHSVNLHLLLFDGRIGLGLDRTTGNAQLGLSRPTASRVTTLLWSSALFLRAGPVHVSLG